jgi:tetratricopeptide (TPR) repeat protein
MRSRLLPAALLAWVVLSPLPARAAESGDTNYFQQAIDAAGRQDYNEAIRCYTVYVESHPTDDGAYNNRGNAYRQTGQYDEALQDYSKAIELNPNQRYSFENRGNLYYHDLVDFDHALRDYSQQIALYGNDTSAFTERGSVYLDQWAGVSDSLLTLAMADFNRAIALDSSYARAWNGRGDVFRDQGKGDSAIANYTRAIDLDPEEVSYYESRALEYESSGQRSSAIDDYGTVIDLAPSDPSAYESRARLYIQARDYPAAIRDYTKLTELDSTENSYYLNRANAYRMNKQDELALRDYGFIINRDPKNAAYRLGRADFYFERGQYDSAGADYTRVIAQLPDEQSDPDARNAQVAAFRNRGRAYLARGQYDSAIEDFTKYLALLGDAGSGDSTTPVLYWRGHAYAGKGEADLAIRDYSKVIDAFEYGNYTPAPAGGETSVYRSPDSVVIGACLNRAGIHLKRGEFDDARSDYGQVIRYDGKNLPARFERAVLDYYAEDYDSAMEDCTTVIDATANPDVPYYACSGIQSSRSGDYHRAVEFFSKGLAVSNRDVDLLNLRGDAYFHSGRADSALGDWRLANTIDTRYPTFAAARETLGLSLDLAYPRSYLGVLLDQAQKAEEAQNYPEALRLANQYIQKYPKDGKGYMFRMTAHLSLNDFDQALADVQTISTLSPDSGGGDMLFGIVYSLRQEWDSAVAHLEAGLQQPGELGIGDLPALLLGFGYYCLGNYGQAVQAYARVPMSGAPTDSEWVILQAVAYLAEGDTAGAVRNCRTQSDNPLSRTILSYREGRMDSVVRIGRRGTAALDSMQATVPAGVEGLLDGLRIAMAAAPLLELEGDAWARLKRPDSARVCWAEAHRLSAAHPIDQAGRDALGLGPGGQSPVASRPVARPIQAPPQPLLPAPNVFTSGRPNGYALVIGLSKYQSVPPPKYGSEDAQAFAEFVAGAFGVTRERTEILLDDRATVGTIRGELIDWLAKKHGFKVIYFAGHGVPDPENPREGDVYLLPYDGNPELKSTLIPLKDIAELGTNEGDTVLLFLDACFSGAGEGRTASIASRPLVVAKLSETKAITMAAAEGTQPSKEFEKAQHGYFTYYTLLGLKGAADKPPYGNDDGWVTTTELYKYVKDKVSDATNDVQVPVFRPEREIKLGRYR